MRVFLVLCLTVASVSAQSPASDSSSSDTGTRRITAVSQFFDHDFLNVYAFGNGIWDSRQPILTTSSTFASGFGWEDVEAGYRLYQVGARFKFAAGALSIHVSPVDISDDASRPRYAPGP